MNGETEQGTERPGGVL